jgi:RimJ/RimL family protein N-acetyltransferase
VTTLRAIEPADLDFLVAEYDGPHTTGEFGWYGFRDPAKVREDLSTGKTLEPDGGRLVVADDDGKPVGLLSYITTFNGPPPGGDCWNIGIWIAPEHRGKGHGAEAQRLAAAYLFAHTLRERVEASTETGNVAEQRALERAGFTREGVIRHGSFRDGAYRDMVMYSKLRGE